MKRSILKKIIKEEILKENSNQSLDRDTIINAYKEAYKSETGNDLDITNFTYFSHTPSNTQTQTIEISKLVSNGEELGDVTLINNGSGWEFGGSIKLSEGFEEDNISLADLEEFGYEEGEKVFEKLESGGLFQNRHDFNAYKKGFMQGFIDSASAYNLNENVTGFSFSREEVENAANTLAQAISKTDDIETYVHDFEYDENRGGGFEIGFVNDGVRDDSGGGSYGFGNNGEIINYAVREKPVYGNIGDTEEEMMGNLLFI